MTTDPKAAEREAAAHAFMVSRLSKFGAASWCHRGDDLEHDSECVALVALLATRERDAAVGALRDGLKACAALDEMLSCHRVGRPPTEAMWKRINAARAWIVSARLALEQGTPATIPSSEPTTGGTER